MNERGASTDSSSSRIEPPSDVLTTRVCPGVDHAPSCNVSEIGGRGPYRRLNTASSGTGSVKANAWSTGNG